MQRRVEGPDGHRPAAHGAEDTLEVGPLQRHQPRQSGAALLHGGQGDARCRQRTLPAVPLLFQSLCLGLAGLQLLMEALHALGGSLRLGVRSVQGFCERGALLVDLLDLGLADFDLLSEPLMPFTGLCQP